MNKYRKYTFLDVLLTAIIIATAILAFSAFVYTVVYSIETAHMNRIISTYEAIERGVY